MDPFEAFENQQNSLTSGDVDPAAEFLAREQAEMDKIQNGDDGFGNDFDAFASAPPAAHAQIGGFDSNSDFNTFNELNGESETDPVPEAPAKQDLYSSISTIDRHSQEPETIKKWRDDQKLRLEAKDAEEEVKKRELREAAKKELEDWYKNRQEQLVKTKENIKKLVESEYSGSSEGASAGKPAEWDKVSKLCEFNPKANKNVKDVSRFRSILLQLKQQPLLR